MFPVFNKEGFQLPVSGLRNYRKCKYIFTFPKINSAPQRLRQSIPGNFEEMIRTLLQRGQYVQRLAPSGTFGLVETVVGSWVVLKSRLGFFPAHASVHHQYCVPEKHMQQIQDFNSQHSFLRFHWVKIKLWEEFFTSTHHGLVMPYGDIDVGQYWLR